MTSAAATAATQPAIIITFEFQPVITASAEYSIRGISIRCSLFGDQKLLNVACPEATDRTRGAYHHSSANGTFTPFSTINASVTSAAIAQSDAAASKCVAGGRSSRAGMCGKVRSKKAKGRSKNG